MAARSSSQIPVQFSESHTLPSAIGRCDRKGEGVCRRRVVRASIERVQQRPRPAGHVLLGTLFGEHRHDGGPRQLQGKQPRRRVPADPGGHDAAIRRSTTVSISDAAAWRPPHDTEKCAKWGVRHTLKATSATDPAAAALPANGRRRTASSRVRGRTRVSARVRRLVSWTTGTGRSRQRSGPRRDRPRARGSYRRTSWRAPVRSRRRCPPCVCRRRGWCRA